MTKIAVYLALSAAGLVSAQYYEPSFQRRNIESLYPLQVRNYDGGLKFYKRGSRGNSRSGSPGPSSAQNTPQGTPRAGPSSRGSQSSLLTTTLRGGSPADSRQGSRTGTPSRNRSSAPSDSGQRPDSGQRSALTAALAGMSPAGSRSGSLNPSRSGSPRSGRLTKSTSTSSLTSEFRALGVEPGSPLPESMKQHFSPPKDQGHVLAPSPDRGHVKTETPTVKKYKEYLERKSGTKTPKLERIPSEGPPKEESGSES